MHGASHSQGHTHSVYASPRHVNACQLESQRGLGRLPVETAGPPSYDGGHRLRTSWRMLEAPLGPSRCALLLAMVKLCG